MLRGMRKLKGLAFCVAAILLYGTLTIISALPVQQSVRSFLDLLGLLALGFLLVVAIVSWRVNRKGDPIKAARHLKLRHERPTWPLS